MVCCKFGGGVCAIKLRDPAFACGTCPPSQTKVLDLAILKARLRLMLALCKKMAKVVIPYVQDGYSMSR